MEKLTFLSGCEVTHEDIRQMLQLDIQTYAACYHLDTERCYGYYDKNNQIYIICKDEKGKLVGYVNFSPITDKFYDGLRSGKFIDSDLTPEDMVTYEDNEKLFNGYLSSIIVHESYQGRGIARGLLLKLMDKIEHFHAEGIRFGRLILDAVSVQGEVVAGKLGMKKIVDSQHGSKIFEAVLIPFEIKNADYNTKICQLYAMPCDKSN